MRSFDDFEVMTFKGIDNLLELHVAGVLDIREHPRLQDLTTWAFPDITFGDKTVDKHEAPRYFISETIEGGTANYTKPVTKSQVLEYLREQIENYDFKSFVIAKETTKED